MEDGRVARVDGKNPDDEVCPMTEMRKRNDDAPLKDIASGEVAKETGASMKYGVAWIWALVVLFFVALVWFSVQGGWRMV